MRRSAASVREEVRRACRTAPDTVALQRGVAQVLPDAVPFDRWCGLVLDPATMLATSGYHGEGLPLHLLPRLLQIEAADDDVNGMTALARTKNGVSTIHRATADRPESSERYRDVLAPVGLGRELRAVLRDRSSGWGGFILFRETSAPDFTDDEVAFIAQVGEDLARGIRRCLLLSEHAHRDASAVPGMLAVGAGGLEVEMVTAAATRWLDAIHGGSVTGGVPLVVGAVVTRARSNGDGVARARLRTREGQWVTLYAEAMSEAPDAPVAVVIEPTRPHELAAIIADAYLLTPREREVAQQVLLGRSTQQIATALFLTPWTVQDHLKKVFDKVGVRSRSELTTRFFFGHYEPRLLAGSPVGADGWFIDQQPPLPPKG